MTKVCTGCHRDLDESAFAIRKDRGTHKTRCNECEALRARRWRERNPDAARGAGKRHYWNHRDECLVAAQAWREKNRERVLEYSRAYRDEHADENRAAARVYYAEHVDQCQERSRAWKDQHCDEVAAYRAAYKRANPDRVRAWNRRRRARLYGCAGSHTLEDELAQFARQRGRCYWCGEKIAEHHVDHVIPLSKGGSNGPENIVISCPPCNLAKHAKMPHEFAGRP